MDRRPNGASIPGQSLTVGTLDQAWRLAEAFNAGAERSRGLHGTPRAVASELAALVNAPPGGPLLDPASGAGALLLAGLEHRWRRAGRVDVGALIGFDVDPLAVAMTEAVIWVAVGRPPHPPPGRFEVRDFLRDGLGPLPPDSVALANPPWGVKPAPEAVRSWMDRVGPELSTLLAGEINVYTLFLLEIVLGRGLAAGFVTPIHWLHRLSLTAMRHALSDSGRLASVVLLRKRVFEDAPDMIPALTVWGREASDAPITVRRTGFRATLPLQEPLSTPFRTSISRTTWRELPFGAFPLLRSDRFSELSRLLRGWPRLSDPEVPREARWLHLGDGAYKTRVRPHLTGLQTASGWPILTRAAQVGRYRLEAPQERLDEAGMAALSAGERRRFAAPKLLLHAIKKAAASWRLGGAAHDVPERPLALTNNFLVGVGVRYDGDPFYPLTLLNSRLFNRLYTEHFPGVNIEAYTVGVLPFAWPRRPASGAPAPPDQNDPMSWYRWARAVAAPRGYVAPTVYDWLRAQGRRLQAGEGEGADLDRQIEAVVGALFGLNERELERVLELDPWMEG